MWHMKQRLRPLVDSDGAGVRKKYSFDYIMESLKSMRKETVEFCNAQSSVITASTDEQSRIFQLLEINF
jgi:hypothetical protein